ncbi:MAG: hypothetical protein IPH80_34035 [Myxococcales bacterium]|nr:hypothetical protein [Myxococcales bacterium]
MTRLWAVAQSRASAASGHQVGDRGVGRDLGDVAAAPDRDDRRQDRAAVVGDDVRGALSSG